MSWIFVPYHIKHVAFHVCLLTAHSQCYRKITSTARHACSLYIDVSLCGGNNIAAKTQMSYVLQIVCIPPMNDSVVTQTRLLLGFTHIWCEWVSEWESYFKLQTYFLLIVFAIFFHFNGNKRTHAAVFPFSLCFCLQPTQTNDWATWLHIHTHSLSHMI